MNGAAVNGAAVDAAKEGLMGSRMQHNGCIQHAAWSLRPCPYHLRACWTHSGMAPYLQAPVFTPSSTEPRHDSH